MWPKVGSARSRVATAALLLSHSLSLGACSGTDAEEEGGEGRPQE